MHPLNISKHGCKLCLTSSKNLKLITLLDAFNFYKKKHACEKLSQPYKSYYLDY